MDFLICLLILLVQVCVLMISEVIIEALLLPRLLCRPYDGITALFFDFPGLILLAR